MSPVANSADATRELFVRRLAAGDKNMDIINMDTIYTPEFAEAGWMTELTGANKEDALDDVLDGPAQSVTWKDKVYGIPTNTNVQLLWYRKDLVPKPPETWDEMIAMAKKLPPVEGNILEQGQKYEGYVVWFNNLVASAGGEIVDAEGRRCSTRRRSRPRRSSRDVARSGRADPSLSTAQEDPSRLAFEADKGAFLLNWPYVYAARARRTRRPPRSPRRSSRTWATPAGRASTRASRARSRSAAPTSASRRRASTPSSRSRPRCA